MLVESARRREAEEREPIAHGLARLEWGGGFPDVVAKASSVAASEAWDPELAFS